jgi:hypothetical protein
MIWRRCSWFSPTGPHSLFKAFPFTLCHRFIFIIHVYSSVARRRISRDTGVNQTLSASLSAAKIFAGIAFADLRYSPASLNLKGINQAAQIERPTFILPAISAGDQNCRALVPFIYLRYLGHFCSQYRAMRAVVQ